MVERSQEQGARSQKQVSSAATPIILLLPGSRVDELRRHLPVMLGALKLIQAKLPECHAKMVLPTETLMRQAKSLRWPADAQMQVGGLPEALGQADVAIAKSGTITLECAYFGVPTVVLYKTSWPTYFTAKTMVNVKHVAMPNLLANEEIFPEFIQNAATPGNIASAALPLLRDDTRRKTVQAKLAKVIASLGGPGASQRAAEAIVKLLRGGVP